MPTPLLAAHDPAQTDELLVGFPTEVVTAYRSFAETGDGSSLDAAVLGILQHYLSVRPAAPLRELPLSTRLSADLGCDSLTMIDMVFLAESLFSIHVGDDELAKVSTLGGLLAHFRQHLNLTAVAA